MSLDEPLPARRAKGRPLATDPHYYCSRSRPARRAAAPLADYHRRPPTASVPVRTTSVSRPRVSSARSATTTVSSYSANSAGPAACTIYPWSVSLCTNRHRQDSEAVVAYNRRCSSRIKLGSDSAGKAWRWWCWWWRVHWTSAEAAVSCPTIPATEKEGKNF